MIESIVFLCHYAARDGNTGINTTEDSLAARIFSFLRPKNNFRYTVNCA
jgi:hypothetical protein